MSGTSFADILNLIPSCNPCDFDHTFINCFSPAARGASGDGADWILGPTPLGNAGHGIHITGDSSNNRIGRITPSDGNLIAYNGGDGIYVESGNRNTLLSNSIYSNGGLGIDLGPNGVTPNDNLDADIGANDLQNAPVLERAASDYDYITGFLRSTPNTSFTIQFFVNPPGGDEGQSFLGSLFVTTDATGFVRFQFNTLGLQDGDSVTATATSGVPHEWWTRG